MTCKYKQCPSSDDGQHCYHQEGYSSGSTSKCCHCGRVENNKVLSLWSSRKQLSYYASMESERNLNTKSDMDNSDRYAILSEYYIFHL